AHGSGSLPAENPWRFWKEPSPLPNNPTTLPLLLATTRSRRPSLFRSPNATERGAIKPPRLRAGWYVPSPLPSSTLTVVLPLLATARSSRPSLFTAPAAPGVGDGSVSEGRGGRNRGRVRS